MSVQDIQVFIGLANFYWRFIQSFNTIAAPLTSLLKTTRSFKVLTPKLLRADDNEVVEVGSKADEIGRNLSKFKKLKNEKSEVQIRIRALGETTFLISSTRKAFNHLRQAFIEAPILRYFDLEYYI